MHIQATGVCIAKQSRLFQSDEPLIPKPIPLAFFFSCPSQALFSGLAPVPQYHQHSLRPAVMLPYICQNTLFDISQQHTQDISPAVQTHPFMGQLLSSGIYSTGVPKAAAFLLSASKYIRT